MADEKSKTCESENRGHDPRPLATEARGGAPMDRNIEAHNRPYVYRSNGLDTHDFESKVSAWYQAWAMLKPLIFGVIGMFAVIAYNFTGSMFFNKPVVESKLAAVTSEQRVTNVELQASIKELTRTTQSHERVLERLASTIGDVRRAVEDVKNNISFMSGAFSSGHLQSYSPPLLPPPPFTYPRTRSQPADWPARTE
jgi:hypothetical protein